MSSSRLERKEKEKENLKEKCLAINIHRIYRVARTRLNVASLNLRDGIASIDKSVVGPLLGVLL